jgi:hypothetical protein
MNTINKKSIKNIILSKMINQENKSKLIDKYLILIPLELESKCN